MYIFIVRYIMEYGLLILHWMIKFLTGNDPLSIEKIKTEKPVAILHPVPPAPPPPNPPV
jgi:hypothetical protein